LISAAATTLPALPQTPYLDLRGLRLREGAYRKGGKRERGEGRGGEKGRGGGKEGRKGGGTPCVSLNFP